MGRLVRSVLALVCALALAPAWAAAQGSATISGRVVSDAGTPLASASVFIEGLNQGTLTKEDGRYSFVVPGARVNGQTVTITARLIGFKAQSVQMTLSPGAHTQDFTLAANPLRLGEVVVTGAGTATTREKLGNVINSVDSAAITRSNETNVVNAIAGKAPNVNIVSQSGEPGASSYIRIRGIKSLTGNAQPLFVVDGVPIDNSTFATEAATAGTVTPNRASDINPNDIESIDILKGAAAAAIYGARASDGVVLITTKSGHSGATRYSLRSNTSFDDVNHKVPLQRTYGQGSRGSFTPCSTLNCSNTSTTWGPQLDPSTPTYDHFGEMFHTGTSYDNNLSVSGGNDRTTFFLSGGYLDQNGTIIGPNNWYKKTTARLKGTHRLLDRLSVGGNLAYADDKGSFIQKGSNISGLLLGALRTPPEFNNAYYLDSTSHLQRSYRFPNPSPSSLTSGRGYDNPFFVVNQDVNTEETNRAYGNINLDYDPLDWLSVKYTLGADYYSDYRLTGFPFTSTNFPAGEVIRGDIMNYQIDHNLIATAQHTFSPGFAGTFTLGQNLNNRRYRRNFVTGTTLIGPTPFALQNTVNWSPQEYRFVIHTESYFGQATADLFNQLYLTAALRNDGFSTFGESNPRAWYPKVSAAWTFTNFLGNTDQKGLLSFGKIRAAYGQTGKEPTVYSTITALNNGLFGGGFGGGWGDYLNATQSGFGGLSATNGRGNANLKPEREKELELGLDLGFLDQRADAGLTYYNNNSEDVILQVPTAPSTGYAQALLNGAKIRNRGWEATLNVRPITRGDVAWEVGFQWATNTTRILDLKGAEFINTGGVGAGTFTGAYGAATLGGTFGLRGQDFVRCGRGLHLDVDGDNVVDDVDALCGAGAKKGALFIGADGFPVNDPTDRVIADPNPDWTGSVRTSFRYRKWQVSALVDHKQGGQVWNGTKGALYNFGTHKDTQIRGQTRTFGKDFFAGSAVAGPGVGTPVVIDQDWFTGLGSGFGPVSSQFIEDGTYTKLREISVAYTFDQPWVAQKVGFSSIDVRLAGRNLKTWTSYNGIDPEANLGGAEVLIQGIDYFNNPQTRSIVLSIGLNR
jgi:TonB-linked SusC/RagA family outer membrane protein